MSAFQIMGPSRQVLNLCGETQIVPHGRYALCGMIRRGESSPRMVVPDLFPSFEKAEEVKKELEQDE